VCGEDILEGEYTDRQGRDRTQASWSVVRRLVNSSLGGGSDGTGALSQSQIRRGISWSKQQEQVEDAEAALDGRREREERGGGKGELEGPGEKSDEQRAGLVWTDASGICQSQPEPLGGAKAMQPLDRLQGQSARLKHWA
jgi:hypothetical protein